MHRNLILILSLLFFFSPVSAEITSFWPGFENSISNIDVTDITNGPDGSVVFATFYGLSSFNDGKWTILHSKTGGKNGYPDGLPLADYIKCVEYDNQGNLWLGYNDGIQIYNGYTNPVNIIKEYPSGTLASYHINDLQCLGEQMWVATGSSGVYCYQNGEWKWFKPFGESDLSATKITSMAVDYSTGSLYLASAYRSSSGQGHYILLNDNIKNPHFDKILDSLISDDMENVRTNKLGGVYFFNKTDIVSYNTADGALHILNVKDISCSINSITDISSTDNGKIIIGTDSGLYAYKDGIVTDSFSRKELINNQIKKVFVDSDGRWWFTNKYFAGYYYQKEFNQVISIELL